MHEMVQTYLSDSSSLHFYINNQVVFISINNLITILIDNAEMKISVIMKVLCYKNTDLNSPLFTDY